MKLKKGSKTEFFLGNWKFRRWIRRIWWYLWRLSVTLCLKPVGGLTCHSTSSFWRRLQAILLRA